MTYLYGTLGFMLGGIAACMVLLLVGPWAIAAMIRYLDYVAERMGI